MKVAARAPILAIDTATRHVGLALYDGQSVWSECSWRAEQSHTTTLMPNLTRMLDDQEQSVARLGGLAVALGPGSFTGLRIGLAVAKGLALARDIPLIGVPTLDIVAYSCSLWPMLTLMPLSLRACLEAGRDRFCVADYRCIEGEVCRESDYRIVERDDLGTDWSSPTDANTVCLFCGELDAETERILRARLGDRALVAPPAARLRRPGYLAELGWQRLMQGKEDDPITLSPIYLRTTSVRP